MRRLTILAALAALPAACGPSSPSQSRVHSASSEAPPPTRDNLAQRLLAIHNHARDEAGVPRLAWNAELARGAESWALTIARDGKMRHSDRGVRSGLGENLWMGTADFFTIEHMLDGMVKEKRYFTPGTFPDVSRTGKWADVAHYTQIIWRESREVGCALASANGRDALVCRYSPAGNVVGQKVG